MPQKPNMEDSNISSKNIQNNTSSPKPTGITRLSPVKILVKILEEFKLVWNMSPKVSQKSRELIDEKLSELKELIKLK